MIIENPLFTEDIPEKGATRGHVLFSLRSRSPQDVALVGFCANIAASLLFERLQAQGTNLIIELAKDDAAIHVLARSENDGLNLVWPPKPLEQSQLADVQERIRNKTFFIGKAGEPPKGAVKEAPAAKESKEMPKGAPEVPDHDHEDYLVKQLHRIP